ncbi:MAG: hypothetical protein PF692_09320, partial [Kiritimatiellae bacterium]|nr:hypothetical protein [Kiritimatiellia bacterium]
KNSSPAGFASPARREEVAREARRRGVYSLLDVGRSMLDVLTYNKYLRSYSSLNLNLNLNLLAPPALVAAMPP